MTRGIAALTTLQVMELRRMYADPRITVEEIARHFGLSSAGGRTAWHSGTVSKIATGKLYKYVPGAVRGRKNNAAMTPAAARDIRYYYALHKPPLGIMAEIFRTNRTTLTRILHGEIFKDAGGPVFGSLIHDRSETCSRGHSMPENAILGSPGDCRLCKRKRTVAYQSQPEVKERRNRYRREKRAAAREELRNVS